MRLRARSRLAVGAPALYAWHIAPGAFLNLLPPWETLRLVGADQGISPGCLRQLKVTPLGVPWWAYHDEFVQDRQFRDVQQRGPCRRWEHSHRFEPETETECILTDEVDFELPLEPLSRLVYPLLRAQFQAMFLYRHRVTNHCLRAVFPGKSLRLAVTGASGLIGRQLVPFLSAAGHRVVRLVRRPPQASDEVAWNPLEASAMPELEGLDGVIHLAGKGVLDGNFGAKHRHEIWTSRVDATQHLVAALARLDKPPAVFISASGTGFYGAHSEAVFDEDSPAGKSFLADVCQAWEDASQPLEARGTRRVLLRIAPLLHLRGGALAPMYYTTLCGPSWRLGAGDQPFSWVAMEDVLGLAAAALIDDRWRGPVNAVSPESTTLGVCSRAVGTVLGGRPQLSLPEGPVRRLMGSRADLLLGSCRAHPARALEWGYKFCYPGLLECLRHALGRYNSDDYPSGWSFEWGALN